jgi:ABC-type antimicrobial peptide transport system permease subunit
VAAPAELNILLLAVLLAVLCGLIAGAIGGLRAAQLRPASALRSVE